jgi:pimeloyl-ACP methyl ester carboxylesterase
VLVPDLRGFGWSDAPRGDYAKSTLAADVLALLDAEGISEVRILGHDWGAYVAFLLALEHPSRVERLVALDIAPPWPGRPRPRHLALPWVGAYQALLATPRLGAWSLTSNGQFIRSIIRAASGPRANWTDDELDIYADVQREPVRAGELGLLPHLSHARAAPVRDPRRSRQRAARAQPAGHGRRKPTRPSARSPTGSDAAGRNDSRGRALPARRGTPGGRGAGGAVPGRRRLVTCA